MSKRFTYAVLLLVLVLSFLPISALGDSETVITIYHTNDLHARVEEGRFDGMGFAKMATIIDEVEDALLVDAGDAFHGKPMATIAKGESIARIMNLLGYDFMAPGNHDFNYGSERLLELDDVTDFSILCANVKKGDDYFLTPYEVKKIKGKKIGFFGLATPETYWKSHPKNTAGLTIIDPVVGAREAVAALKSEKVDLIVCISHIGQDVSSEETSLEIAEQVQGIDLIIDGHSHTSSEDVKSTADTLIVSADEYGKQLGKVVITFEGDSVKLENSVINKDEVAEVEPNEEVEALVAQIKEEQASYTEAVIGATAVKLHGERAEVRAGETNLGNLITDSMRYVSGAEVALTNGGGIRSSIAVGEITKGDIIAVLPFGNYIQAKRVTGQDIYDALDHGASDWPATKGAFCHVSGITYKIDASKKSNRVFNVIVNGEPLMLDRYYTLATNDFVAGGGDDFTMFKNAEHIGDFPALDEAVIDYIAEFGVVKTETEKRIIGFKADEEVTLPEITAPASGKNYYEVKPGDFLWKIAKEYGTTWENLAEINNLDNANLILPGQQILVP